MKEMLDSMSWALPPFAVGWLIGVLWRGTATLWDIAFIVTGMVLLPRFVRNGPGSNVSA